MTIERAKLISDNAKQHIHQFENKTLESVTLSLGVAIFPEHGSTSAALLKAADDALYQAKFAGRDRAVVAEL